MGVKRGAVVVVALHGDYGKPRPALVVQSEAFSALSSVTVLPITSDLRDAPLYRINVEASPETGLHKPSQIMVDKSQTVPREKIGQVVGYLDYRKMVAVNRAMALFLGFA
ncbi:type II toxin-antitoxin system PemK/MazF family toxin [Acidithiobacillus thiooxidans]|uniref:type II toxin-antitoxin system PemK/MazF family toxin n=1 Tax=Acidithiobacillus thiooxidans TaxID=930 RepID=UPI001FD28F35|nr:type II toxin-antitoxin system PemK/MazF family toxin [Acidithiobacillus thiooxidans]